MKGTTRRPVQVGLLILGLGLGLGVSVAEGGGTRSFEIADFARLTGLDLQGAALTLDGGLVAGPHQEIRVGPAVPVLWDVVPLADGGAYAVGGSPGAVLFLPPRGEGRRIAEFEEAEVTAAALWNGGHLVVAVSPGGLLFEIDGEGTKTEIAQVDSRYIWDLLVDEGGSLWIAGGSPGALLRLDAGAERAKTVLDLGVQHVRCLASHPQGGIVVGASGSGEVRWIGADGRVSVIHDADLDEIAALAVAPDGTIYASVVGLVGGKGGAPAVRSSRVATTPPAGTSSVRAKASARPAARSAAKTGGERSRVVAIATDGSVRTLWTSSSQVALALLAQPDGEVWTGVSPEGTILSIAKDGRSVPLARLPARSVTALRRGTDGRIWATTGGLGLLAVFDPSAAGEGTAIGPVFDAGPGTVFGRLEWWARSGDPDGIVLSLRSGNTGHPDATWSPWSPWYKGGRAAAPAAPPGRYLQWRARMPSARESARPELRRLRLAYLPQNRAPEVSKVEVLPSGLVLEPLPSPPGQGVPPSGGAAKGAPTGQLAGKNPPLPAATRTRRMFRPGRRTLAWKAEDADGDPLVTRLWLRADGEADYVLFAEGIDTPFHVFDEAALPDGGFVFQVEVSDQLANTLERGAVTTVETSRFVIDRTPPVIASLRHVPGPGSGELIFSVEDGSGAPQEVEIRVDEQIAFGALPADGLADESPEAYRVALPALQTGEHVAAVMVTDRNGNVSSARIRFQVQENVRR